MPGSPGPPPPDSMCMPRLMLVTDRSRCSSDMVQTIGKAAGAGLEFVQVREKDLDAEELGVLVCSIREAIGSHARIVVNSSLEIAERTKSGLHLPAALVKNGARPGAARPFGCSIHDPDELQAALALSPDYLVAGTVFSTASKPGRVGIGLEALGQLVHLAGEVPVYAIGGINQHNLAEVLEAGAWGVALASGVLLDPDPEEAVLSLLAAIKAVAGVS
jgi:thiamine-phosphate pyrophosphorylase